MKKLIIFSILMLLLISIISCSKDERDDYATYYSELLPSQEGEYILHSIGDEITLEELEKEDINISEIRNMSSVEIMNEEYPQLELKQSPAYILFDINGLVYKTYDYDKLIKFLKENP